MGSQEPSVRIAPSYRDTDGPDAERILGAGGMTLDPWQRNVLDDWMALTYGGTWASKACGLSVSRQNGKTGIVQGRSNAGGDGRLL